VRRKHRHTSLILISAAVLSLAVSAVGRDPTERFLREGNRLMEEGLFADAVSVYTRALQQDPKGVKVYYHRALANEMVDRQAAIRDWRTFAGLAAGDSRLKEAAAQTQERVQALEKITELPDLLHPSRCVPKAGDYYAQVADASVGLRWPEFPVKVFVDSPPKQWRRALQEALNDWMSVFPLQRVSAREKADIVFGWAKLSKQTVGTERDSMTVSNEDDGIVSRRKKSSIILDDSHRRSEREMRAAVLHELGHALGIGGHSNDSRDVMFPAEMEIFELTGRVPAGVTGLPSAPPGVRASTQINAKLTPRDINTLIRLYNCPGPLVYLK